MSKVHPCLKFGISHHVAHSRPRLRTSFPLLFLLLGACSQRELTTQIASTLGSSGQCKPVVAGQQTMSAQSVVEMETAAFRTESEEQKISEALLAEGSVAFSAGRHISVLVDLKCLKDKNSSHLLVDKILNHSQHNSAHYVRAKRRANLTRFQSIDWELDEDLTESLLRDLVDSDDCIKGVGPSVQFRTIAVPNDNLYSQQKFHPVIQSAKAWDVFFNPASGINKDVVIAIIDSGVNISHVDLKANIWVNTGEIAGNGIDDDRNGYVDDVNGYNFPDNLPSPEPILISGNGAEHGTHVAGLAAATMNNSLGVAGVMGQHVKVMALNVFGKNAVSRTSDIDNAIRYAADNGANIINMSVGGGGESPSTLSAIQYAVSKGVFITVAAGNEGWDLDSPTTFMSPASYARQVNGMIAVASIQSITQQLSTFSDYGQTSVEIAAPGESGMLSTLPGDTYGFMSGTSMASPVVAGAAGLAYGLIWSRTQGKPSPTTIKQLLMSASDKRSVLVPKIKDGNQLNLATLADQVSTQYPVGSSAPVQTLGCQ